MDRLGKVGLSPGSLEAGQAYVPLDPYIVDLRQQCLFLSPNLANYHIRFLEKLWHVWPF